MPRHNMGDGRMIVAIGDMGILATYAAKLQPRSAAALPKPPLTNIQLQLAVFAM